MRKYMIFPLLLCWFALLASGCGSSSSGGAEYFDTVLVTVSSEQPSLDSDIQVWMDSNNDNICDRSIIKPDSISVQIKSQVLSNKNKTLPASDIRIESVRIDYTPADSGTPALDSQFLALGQIIEPDEEVKIDVKVMSQAQKINYPLARLLRRSVSDIYKYHTKLTFNCIEILSDRETDLTTSLSIDVADFVSDEETCHF
ncbi:MAG: hypothetical protein AB1611_08405 [bacterium]